MSKAFIIVPPNVFRKTMADLASRFPGVETTPPQTHAEFAAYFAEQVAAKRDVPDLIVTPYPQALRYVDPPRGPELFEPMPTDLPPMRGDLADKGLAEPNPLIRVVTVFPLVLACSHAVDSPPSGWRDLCDERFRGSIVLPPDDTPVPAIYRFYMRRLFGEAAEPALDTVSPGLSPQDINREVDQGRHKVGVLIPAFGRTFREGGASMVWPCEGALAIPSFAMLRRGAAPDAVEALRYLLSREYQEYLSMSGLHIPVHPDARCFEEMQEADGSLLWAGWECQKAIGEEMMAGTE